MSRFYNPFNNNFPGMNINNNEYNPENMVNNEEGCSCNKMNNNNNGMNFNDNNMNDCGCPRPNCPTTYKTCPPIVTCSKQVIDQYHVTKQPYVHNYHTEIVHHYVTQNEFVPNYTCSEVHVNEPDNSNFPR